MRSQVPAYALFAGKVGPTSNSQIVRDVVLPITSLPTSLGRAPNVDGHLMVDEGDSTLSREHLRVNFNPLKGCYEIACLSKNGAIVDKIRIKKGEVAEVHANSAVRLGSARMYFTVPVDFVERGSHALAAATAGAGATVTAPAPAPAPTTTDTTIAPGANDDGWLKGDAGAIESSKTKKRKIAVAASPAVHKTAAAVVAEKTQEPPAKMARLDSVVAASTSTSTSTSAANSPKSRGKASKANAPPEVIVLSSSSEDISPSAAAAVATTAAVAQVHVDTADSATGGAGSSSRSGSTAVSTVTLNGLGAADLLARAFSSGDLPLTASGGVEQAAVHTWIVDNEKEVTELEHNMKRAIYAQLTKKNSKYKRVESEAPSAEGSKKMPILWAPI